MSVNAASLEQLLRLLPEVVVQTDAHWVLSCLNPAWQKLTDSATARKMTCTTFAKTA